MKQYYVEKENKTLETYGIEFFLAERYSGKDFTFSHSHPSIEVLYIQKGNLEVNIDNETVVASPGDLLLIRANIIHSMGVVNDPFCSYFVLKINPSLIFNIFKGEEQFGYTVPFLLQRQGAISLISKENMNGEIKDILQKMIEEYEKNDVTLYVAERIHAASLLLELLRFLPKEPPFKNGSDITRTSVELIYKSIAFINENYASDITAVDCAQKVNISYSYFAKLFRSVTGKTFKEYLTSTRMSKAKNILMVTDYPVSDIALSCGYANLSYFICEYKKAYGVTPREARKSFFSSNQNEEAIKKQYAEKEN